MSEMSDPGGRVSALLRRLNRQPRAVYWMACALMLVPAVCTWCELALATQVVVNPVDLLLRASGTLSLVLLLAALAVAPLRHLGVALATGGDCSYGKRASDWNWLLRLRRPIGVTAFGYASVHLLLYMVFDLDLRLQEFGADLRDKPFIAIGTLSFLLLLLLAATSTDGWMRRLGRRWKRLHWLIYPASVLAQLHLMLLSKPGIHQPRVCAVLLGLLLAYRLVARRHRQPGAQEHDDGTVPERSSNPITEVPQHQAPAAVAACKSQQPSFNHHKEST